MYGYIFMGYLSSIFSLMTEFITTNIKKINKPATAPPKNPPTFPATRWLVGGVLFRLRRAWVGHTFTDGPDLDGSPRVS